MTTLKNLIISSSIVMAFIHSSDVNAEGKPDQSQEVSKKEFVLLLPSGFEKKDYPGFSSEISFGPEYTSLEKNNVPLVQKECLKKPRNQRVLGGIAASIIGFLVKNLVEGAFDAQDAKLQKKLDAYQASYDATISIPTLSTNCVRFVRGKTTSEGIEVGIDMVVQLDPLYDQQTLQMKILHIETDKRYAKAKGEEKVSFAVSAQFNGFYLDNNKVGQIIKYDEQVIQSGTFGKASKPEKCFVEGNQWSACTPIFAFPGRLSKDSISELTIKVSEVGTDKKKKQIESWKKLLSGFKGEASETLSGAVEELID